MAKVNKPSLALFLPALNDGGAERVMVNLAGAFYARGYQISLVVMKKEGPYLSFVPEGVNVIETGRSLIALLKFLKIAKPDVLLSALPAANLQAIIACMFTKTKLIISEHAFFSVYDDIAFTPKTQVRNLLMRALYRFTYHAMAVSKGAAEDLSKHCSIPLHKITVIANPVDLDAINAQAQEVPDHPWLQPKDVPVILTAGRLFPPKDFETLLRACALVKNQKDCRLIILGEGPKRSDLEKLAEDLGLKDNVAFLGFKINPFSYMKAADVFVLSTRKEGFGYVLVEAMACGTPVISTDCPGGPAEILEQGKWGTLVPPGDEQALANEIVKSLNARPKVDLTSRAADFALDKIIDKYLKMIEAIR